MGIDGFERIYNSATGQVNELIDECQNNHYTVNEYVIDAGSDNHHVCPGCPIGQTYIEEITIDKVDRLIKELEKRQYEIENDLGWHRVYPVRTTHQINHTIQFYSGLNERFKNDFASKLPSGVSGPGGRN